MPMIWLNGRMMPADQLTLPIADRIFEHGLGLFETFRTWDGRAPLLRRHLARMVRSSRELDIPLDPATLPTASDVEHLARANEVPDGLIRLTISGGQLPDLAATVWMTAAPLRAVPNRAGYRVVDCPWPVAPHDPLARHKTLNYWARRRAYEHAQRQQADEAILSSADGRIWEGSRTSLFLIIGPKLITAPSAGPIVPGIMRSLILDRAGTCGFEVEERDIEPTLIPLAAEIFVANSVRGLIPVAHWEGRANPPATTTYPRTNRLARTIRDFLTTTGSPA